MTRKQGWIILIWAYFCFGKFIAQAIGIPALSLPIDIFYAITDLVTIPLPLPFPVLQELVEAGRSPFTAWIVLLNAFSWGLLCIGMSNWGWFSDD